MSRARNSNAFTLIRWFFALSLVMFHGCVAAGRDYFWFVHPHAIVSVFFVMSGMLSYAGFLSRPGAKAFYFRRIRKIIPPYAVVIISTAVAGIFLSSLTVREYLGDAGLYKYLAANLSFLNFLAPELPCVFASNAVTAANSSLWTMKVEVAFYLLLPIVVWLVNRFKPIPVMAVLYAVSVAWNMCFLYLYVSSGNGFYDMLRRQIPGQIMYFVAGMAAVHLQAYLMRHKYFVLVAGLSVWLVCSHFVVSLPAEPVAIAAVITVAAYGSKVLTNVSRNIPNLTYEVYLLHFPIIQIFVACGLFTRAGFFPVLATATAVILVFAIGLHKLCRCF